MSRMLNATVAIIVGTFITLAYWFSLSGPLNTMVAAINAAGGGVGTFTGRNAVGASSYISLLNISTQVLGVWMISTMVAYLIMFFWEGQRQEDRYGSVGPY